VASAITHFIVGGALALPAVRAAPIRRVLPGWAIPVTSGLLAVAPDLDTLPMRLFDLPYDSLLGHRGIFHSLFFLIISTAVLAVAVARHARTAAHLTAVWAGCAITHPLLDMLTDGGYGVMLLFPLSQTRWFFPWQPIRVSPLSIIRFFSVAGGILKSELPFCLAAIAIGVLGFVARPSHQGPSVKTLRPS
jgi:inner membrane protein